MPTISIYSQPIFSSMKRNIIYILLMAFYITLFVPGCTKAPNGYLSSYIYYNQYLVLVPRGTTFASLNNNINDQGSSLPYTVKMTHIYDSAGNSADDIFFKKYPVTLWTGLYNPLTDTTLAQIQSKQRTADTFAIWLNSAGGRLEANQATVNLPLGTYFFDMTVSNSAGVKTYSKVGSFKLVDPDKFSLSNVNQGIRDPNTTLSVATGKTPAITVTQVSSDVTERTIILKIVDKNGKPFNAAAGEIRNYVIPTGLTTYLNFHNWSISTTNSDTAAIYQFATLPFPYFVQSGIYTRFTSATVYYTIAPSAVKYDNRNAGAFMPLVYFQFNVNVPGTYLLTVQLPDVTHT